jgi:hypothetical protein
MERVETLLQKLSEQFNEGANSSQLLLTVQMLQHELLHLQKGEGVSHVMANVHMPIAAPAAVSSVSNKPVVEFKEEKILEVLQVDEADIEAELEEIKRKAEAVERMSLQSRTQSVFEMMDDEVPTLVHQKISNKKKGVQDKVVSEAVNSNAPEGTSLNDTLKKTSGGEISEFLSDTPIKDLKKAIGINDRFVYINELFRGDETMYERSIKTINSFSIWPEAEYWIRRELKIKLGWQDNYELVKQFDQLVKRRFS